MQQAYYDGKTYTIQENDITEGGGYRLTIQIGEMPPIHDDTFTTLADLLNELQTLPVYQLSWDEIIEGGKEE